MNKLVGLVAGGLISVMAVGSGCDFRATSGFFKSGSGQRYVEDVYINMREAPVNQREEVSKLADTKLAAAKLGMEHEEAFNLFVSVGDYEGARRSIEYFKTEDSCRWLQFLDEINKNKERYKVSE